MLVRLSHQFCGLAAAAFFVLGYLLMASRSTLSVSLSPGLRGFVAARVGSGRYRSESEIVAEGLKLLRRQENGRIAGTLTVVRRKIAEGLEQANRGELLDAEEVFRQLLARPFKKRPLLR